MVVVIVMMVMVVVMSELKFINITDRHGFCVGPQPIMEGVHMSWRVSVAYYRLTCYHGSIFCGCLSKGKSWLCAF
jgi:hypothetical protein